MLDQPTRDEVALLSYVDDLLKARTDLNLKPEEIPNVRLMLLEEVNEAINTHLIQVLTDAERTELDGLLKNNATDAELDAFFAKQIPNVSAEITTALLNFRAVYLLPITKSQPTPTEKLADIATNPAVPTPVVKTGNEDEVIMPAPQFDEVQAPSVAPVAPPAPSVAPAPVDLPKNTDNKVIN